MQKKDKYLKRYLADGVNLLVGCLLSIQVSHDIDRKCPRFQQISHECFERHVETVLTDPKQAPPTNSAISALAPKGIGHFANPSEFSSTNWKLSLTKIKHVQLKQISRLLMITVDVTNNLTGKNECKQQQILHTHVTRSS